jgi:hypothetical protein
MISKYSINLITNPNPDKSHSITWLFYSLQGKASMKIYGVREKIMNSILRKERVIICIQFAQKIYHGRRFCEHGNETLRQKSNEEFLEVPKQTVWHPNSHLENVPLKKNSFSKERRDKLFNAIILSQSIDLHRPDFVTMTKNILIGAKQREQISNIDMRKVIPISKYRIPTWLITKQMTPCKVVPWIETSHISLEQSCCWARRGDVMCFLWGTDKPIEFSWVLNKRQDDG